MVFDRGVRVASQQQTLTTDKLIGTFDRPIDFSNAQMAAPTGPRNPADTPQLSVVRCIGEAVLDSKEFDPRGQQTSRDEMKLFDLSIDRTVNTPTSGAISARGPGWVRHVARETSERPGGRPTLPGQPRPPGNAAGPRPGLTYVHVDFQDSVRGNLNRREITFGEATKTVYAPVANWDAELDARNPANLGPEGMVLDAKFLTIRQMPGRTPASQGWVELEASGNVLAEGALFVAVGHRATYSEDKDQLVLEGDGRSPAEISYSQIPGARRTDAKVNRIIYNLRLNHVQLNGAQSLEVDLPQPPPKPKEKEAPQLAPPR